MRNRCAFDSIGVIHGLCFDGSTMTRTGTVTGSGWIGTRIAGTCSTLTGFGFAIFQFFYRAQQAPGIADARFPNAAWYLGLALIFCGTMAALHSILQYRSTLNYLWSGGFAAIAGMAGEQKKTSLYAITGVLIVIGLFAFFSVLLRYQ